MKMTAMILNMTTAIDYVKQQTKQTNQSSLRELFHIINMNSIAMMLMRNTLGKCLFQCPNDNPLGFEN